MLLRMRMVSLKKLEPWADLSLDSSLCDPGAADCICAGAGVRRAQGQHGRAKAVLSGGQPGAGCCAWQAQRPGHGCSVVRRCKGGRCAHAGQAAGTCLLSRAWPAHKGEASLDSEQEPSSLVVVAMHAVSSKPPSCGASQQQSCQCTASWLKAGKINGLHLLQAVAEHVSSLAIIASDVLPAHAFGAASADFRQGVRRATWVGPAWMSQPYREQVQPPTWHASRSEQENALH